MRKHVHEFLKWAPVAVGSGAIAIAGVWEKARGWVAEQAVWAWSAMSDPLIAMVVLIIILVYIAAIVYTGNDTKEGAHQDTSDAILSVREADSSQQWKGEIKHVWLGGENPELPDGLTNATVLACLTNRGTRPCAIPKWRLEIEIDDIRYQFTLIHYPVIVLGSQAGQITFYEEDAIYKKTLSMVAPGEYVEGWATAQIPRSLFEKMAAGSKIILHGEDAMGGGLAVEIVLTGKAAPEIPYFSGVRQTRDNERVAKNG